MNTKQVLLVFLRYLILVAIAIPNLFLFYYIFTPLTVKPSFFIMSLIDSGTYIVANTNNVIFFKGYFASIIPACVAGAAYYLLLILNLSTPMPIKKRIASILFLLLAFLIINLLRITSFALLFTEGYKYFDLTHTATWYFGSTLMVVLIWFANVLIFRINSIPVYTDIKSILSDLKSGQKGAELPGTK